jgi:four helix bundle protein
MPLKNFRSYDLAAELYKKCKPAKLPAYAKDQLLRASLSVCLNLAEGSAKPTEKDRQRFYAIAFGSLREVQSLLELEGLTDLIAAADHLGACLYKLTRKRAS